MSERWGRVEPPVTPVLSRLICVQVQFNWVAAKVVHDCTKWYKMYRDTWDYKMVSFWTEDLKLSQSNKSRSNQKQSCVISVFTNWNSAENCWYITEQRWAGVFQLSQNKIRIGRTGVFRCISMYFIVFWCRVLGTGTGCISTVSKQNWQSAKENNLVPQGLTLKQSLETCCNFSTLFYFISGWRDASIHIGRLGLLISTNIEGF